MSTTTSARATRWSLAAIGTVLLSQCAPACVPPAPDEVAPTTVPAPTTTIQHQGQLTITWDGAGATAPRFGLIGDSTLASIRWAAAWSPLRRWNYTYDAESCRRTSTLSCHGPDGYAPENVIEVMQRLRGRLGSVLVVMDGANDPVNVLASGIKAVVQEAQAQGIGRVVWLTIRNTPDKNAVINQQAQASGGYLVVADWDTYSAPRDAEWTVDGLHLNSTGAMELSKYLAQGLVQFLG
jgi:hypothetical protein